MKRKFPSAQGYPGNPSLVAQVRRATARAALVGFAIAAALTFGTVFYDYWQDDRPAKGTDACEAAQEAIFKDPADPLKPPIDFINEVNHACK